MYMQSERKQTNKKYWHARSMARVNRGKGEK